jgi:hypothetical protein
MRSVAPPLVLLALVLVTAGCVPQESTPTPTPSTTATGSSSPAPGVTPTAVPTSDPAATPVAFGCADAVTLDEMYGYNSNYSAVDFTPDAGTTAAAAIGMQGIACRWVNGSSGVPIDFSFAQPPAAQLGQLDTSFQVAGGVGTAQTVSGPYWVTVSSADLTSEGDAAPLLEIATNSLP